MEIRIYLNLLKRWYWLLILGIGLGIGAGLLYSQYQTPLYRASTKVLVLRAAEDRSIDLSQSDQELAETFIQLLRTRPILEAASEVLGYSVSANQIRIETVQGAQLIQLTVEDSDPQRAADIANSLVDVFLVQNEALQTSRFASSEESLQAQLQQVEQQISGLQSQVTEFSAESLDAQTEFVSNTIADLQAEISAVQEEIIVLSFSGEPYVSTDLQNRRILVTPTQTVAERVEIQGKSDRLAELRSLLDMYQGIYVDLSISRGGGAQGGNTEFTDQMQSALALYQQIYSNLLSNYEAVRLSRLRSTPNVLQVEQAIPPGTPVQPRPTINMILGGIVGLFVFGGIAFLIEYLDDTLRTHDEVSAVLKVPILGNIGEMKGLSILQRGKRKPYMITHPRTPIAEAFRTLRANLEFADVDNPIKTILISSPTLSEGKTTITVNLAIALAQSGKRVALVDADLRRPSVHEALQVPNRAGLSDVLRGRVELDDVVINWGQEYFPAPETMSDSSFFHSNGDSEPHAVLKWNGFSEEASELVLREGESILVGRDIRNDVVLHGRNVSRHHAVIAWRENGFEVADLGSLNGTFINDELVDKPQFLSGNDVIRFFDMEVVYEEIDENERAEFRKSTCDSRDSQYQSLGVITSGSLPPNPAEVLGSKRMLKIIADLQKNSDIVILDSPPAMLAETSLLASKVDGVLAVIRSNRTRASAALGMIDQLTRAEARLLGVVINRLRRTSPLYHYKGYAKYASYSYDIPEGQPKKKGVA